VATAAEDRLSIERNSHTSFAAASGCRTIAIYEYTSLIQFEFRQCVLPDEGEIKMWRNMGKTVRHVRYATHRELFFKSTRQVLYSIAKHAMRRSADEIGVTSISFRPKVFSDPASVVD
jgi:hypothetical protein